jgi:putative addiction module component (TIGR02574 family)
MSIDAILKEVEELSPEERAELMSRLRDRFDEPGELSDELKALLDRRIAEADANPGAGIPWEVVKAESLKRARA